MSFTQCSAQAHPCLGYVCPNPRVFSATPRSAGTPFTSSRREPESNLRSWAGLRALLFPNGLCPVPTAGVMLGTRELPPTSESGPQCPVPLKTPLLSLSPGSYMGQCLVTRFPHPSGEKAELLVVSMLLPAVLRTEGAQMDPEETQLISSRTLQGGFVQPPGEQLGLELPPQSCCAPFVSPCSSTLPKTAWPRGRLTKSRGAHEAGVALGVSRLDISLV